MASEKPNINLATHWHQTYNSGEVMVEYTTVPFQGFEAEIWRVVPGKQTGVRKKTFYGELGWSNARRYASDVDSEAWYAFY